VTDRVVLAKFDSPTGGGVSDTHTPDSHNPVVRDAKIMEHRGFEALYMDVDPPATFAGDFAVNIVYIAIVDVYVFVGPLSPFDQDIDTEQLSLVLIGSIGIGDFQTVDLPVRRILQKHPGNVLATTVDPGSFAASVDIDRDRRSLCAFAQGCEHPVKVHSPPEKDGVSRQESASGKGVERLL
jgi:hypothetical protein